MSVPSNSDPAELPQLQERYERSAAGPEKLAAGLVLAASLAEHARYVEAIHILNDVTAQAAGPGERAKVLRQLGWVHLRLSEYDRAYQLLGEALALLSVRNTLDLFQVYYDIAWMFYRQGYLENSRNYCDGAQLVLQNLVDAPPEGAERARIELLHIKALIDAAAGEHDAAAVILQTEIEAHRRSGDNYRLAGAYNKLASVSLARGDVAAALANQQQAHEVAQRCDEGFRLALSHKNYGDIFFIIGDLDRSLEHYQRSLQLAAAIHNRLGEVFSVGGIAKVLCARGECAQALEQSTKALATAHDLDNKDRETCLLVDLAELHNRCQHPDDALACLERAERIEKARGLGVSPRHVLARARALLAGGAPQAVEQACAAVGGLLASPIKIDDEEMISVPELQIDAHALMAQALLRQGQRGPAAEEAAKAAALVDAFCARLDEPLRPLFRARPQIAAVAELQRQLAAA